MNCAPLRIAWFSDCADSSLSSLSGYTSRLLLPELAKHHTIDIFSNSFSSTEYGLPHYHYLTAYHHHKLRPYDLFFYQLEDSPGARFMRGHLGLIPGVVWIHDLFCRDLGPEACHTSPWEQSIKQFYDPALPFAVRLKAPHQLWPRLFREVSLSPVVLFSSEWAHNEFRRMTSNRLEAYEGGHESRVFKIPAEISGAARHLESEQLFTVACSSCVGIEGRAHKFLAALRGFSTPWKLRWMVAEHELAGAQALVQEFGLLNQQVELHAGRSAGVWQTLIKESDCAIHFHTSVFGGLAPYLQISMANGCPVIVAASAQGEDIPESVAFRIIPGIHEAAQITEVLNQLRADREGVFGALSLEYARQHTNVVSVAAELSNFLCSMAPQVSHVMNHWDSLRKRAARVLLDEVRTLVDTKGEKMSPYESLIRPAVNDLGWG